MPDHEATEALWRHCDRPKRRPMRDFYLMYGYEVSEFLPEKGHVLLATTEAA